MRAGFPSATDRGLAAAAAELAGIPVSDRQVKRWRGDGLIATPGRSWPGYAQGSQSSLESYPPGTIERIAAIARWAKEGVGLNDIAILLFVEGESYPMSLDRVRSGCAALAASVLNASVWRHSGSAETPTERAELAAAHVMKA